MKVNTILSWTSSVIPSPTAVTSVSYTHLDVYKRQAQRILPRMQGMEMHGGMASDNGYYMGMTLSSYAKGGDRKSVV